MNRFSTANRFMPYWFISENEDQSFDGNIDPEDFLPDSINISSRLNGEDAKVSENAADNPVLVELD